MQTIAEYANGYKHISPLAMLPQTPVLPEAACSVNLFVEIEGHGRAQVTGRGFTPGEAADNLVQTIASVRAVLAPTPPPAPPTRTEQVAALLAKWLACAMAKGDTGLAERVMKAAALVLGDKVTLGEDGQHRVSSLTNSALYVVADGACTCPDAQHHPERACKHRLSTELAKRLTT